MRTSDCLAVLFLLVTVLDILDRTAVLDRELLPGLVLTTVLELELRGVVRTADLELEEELRGVLFTTVLDEEDEFRDDDRTAGLDRFTDGVLLTALLEEDELFFELLVRTEVLLDLLLLDPDFRCASTSNGKASMAKIIMMIYFFMVSGYYFCFTYSSV